MERKQTADDCEHCECYFKEYSCCNCGAMLEDEEPVRVVDGGQSVMIFPPAMTINQPYPFQVLGQNPMFAVRRRNEKVDIYEVESVEVREERGEPETETPPAPEP